MNKVIVTTSINGPTEAIRKFAAMEDWTLVDVLDRKSPEENGGERLHDVIYLNCSDQEKIDSRLSDVIGWNCIQRRNFGFIYAIKELKADIVATVDDDNVPVDDWGSRFRQLLGEPTECTLLKSDFDVCDPISAADPDGKLWHRGFPIQFLKNRYCKADPELQKVEFDVQADFWNGEPDVDAICRMIHHTDGQDFCPDYFPFHFNKPSPFNSQNTFLLSSVIPHYFMFPGIGRMDDIWASYHAQAHGFKVVYGSPSVVQKRNDHNLTKDMMAEYLGYEHNHEIVKEILTDNTCVTKRLPYRAKLAFDLYQAHFI